MEENTVPYACHIFVCTNDRRGERKSCADDNSPAVRDYLKQEVKNRGWLGKVRVSQCGCLGLCAKGSNVILYPHKTWFSGVTEADAETILAKVAELIDA